MNTFNPTRRSPAIRSQHRNIAADTSSISVTQLNRQVKSLLENSFLSIRVQGELSNFAKPSSGHWYFTLKDNKAQIRCAMFKGNNRVTNFSPKEGDEVIVQAKVSLYEGRGDYQLICDSMETAGSGRLQLAFEQLKAKLLKEGLFDARNKKSIPSLIKHLAVITSPSGAAIHDVLSVLKRRYPGLPVTIYPSQVQGAQAADTIIHALALAQNSNYHDAILITRGGGSLEDLWPFNEEKLARAIYQCNIPVISAVGHEVDFSITDLVADYRAATPSAAAEYLSPDQDSLKIHVDQLQTRLTRAITYTIEHRKREQQNLKARLRAPQQRLTLQRVTLKSLNNKLNELALSKQNHSRQRLALLSQQLNNLNPIQLVSRQKLQLKHLKTSLYQQVSLSQTNSRQQLKTASAMLNSVSPLATLVRGYSITKTKEGDILTDSNSAKNGDQIITKLHRGEIHSTITQVISAEVTK